MFDIQFRYKPQARLVFLSQIAQAFIPTSGSPNSESIERFVYGMLNWRNRLQSTPISRFSLLLRALYRFQLELEADELPLIRKGLLKSTLYRGLTDLPGGPEIVHTLDIIRLYLGYEAIDDLTSAQETLTQLKALDEPLIRPAVVRALQALGDISAQVARYQASTSLSRQTTALNLAAGRLQELDDYVRQEVQPPERVLLIRVVGLWQDIVAEAQGALGQSALRGMSRAEQRAVSSSDPRADIWTKPSNAEAVPAMRGKGASAPAIDCGMTMPTPTM